MVNNKLDGERSEILCEFGDALHKLIKENKDLTRAEMVCVLITYQNNLNNYDRSF